MTFAKTRFREKIVEQVVIGSIIFTSILFSSLTDSVYISSFIVGVKAQQPDSWDQFQLPEIDEKNKGSVERSILEVEIRSGYDGAYYSSQAYSNLIEQKNIDTYNSENYKNEVLASNDEEESLKVVKNVRGGISLVEARSKIENRKNIDGGTYRRKLQDLFRKYREDNFLQNGFNTRQNLYNDKMEDIEKIIEAPSTKEDLLKKIDMVDTQNIKEEFKEKK